MSCVHVVVKGLARGVWGGVLLALMHGVTVPDCTAPDCPRQRDLREVLKAYAMYNVKTGYCQVRTFVNSAPVFADSASHTSPQAMAPVAATLLMHMSPEVRACADVISELQHVIP